MSFNALQAPLYGDDIYEERYRDCQKKNILKVFQPKNHYASFIHRNWV